MDLLDLEGNGRPRTRARTRTTLTPSALPTSVKNKPWLAVKVAAFAITGFGTPFFMAWYQM